MSETAASRDILARYCEGVGLDVGYGGDPVVPHALTYDLWTPYTNVGAARQIFRSPFITDHTEPPTFPFICNDALDYLYSAHLLEDFAYSDLVPCLLEWRRVLRPGGLIITNCPNQQRFLAHCHATGQPLNLAHKEPDFSLETFEANVLAKTGPWEPVLSVPEHGAYSWLSVVRKV